MLSKDNYCLQTIWYKLVKSLFFPQINPYMNDEWYLIANPVAGSGLPMSEWNGIQETLTAVGIKYKANLSEAKEHIYHLAQRGLNQGYRKFVAVGGDGTLHDVLNGLFRQKEIPKEAFILTAFPMGTGSDWSKNYGISRRMEDFVYMLIDGKNIPQDIGRISLQQKGKTKEHYFINVAGLGYDAFVVKETQHNNASSTWARIAYLFTALRSLSLYKSQFTHITGEGFEKKGMALFSNVGICKFSGGGMSMVPRALADDGLFDITFVDEIGPLAVLRNIIKLYNGRLYSYKKAHHFRSPFVKIEGEEPILIEADGELLGSTPAHFDLIPAAIQVRVPSSYKS